MAFQLSSRRYMGSKTKLLPIIEQNVLELCGADSKLVFADIFGGTGVVTENFMQFFDTCHINDLLISNEVIYRAFFEKSEYDMRKVVAYAAKLRQYDFSGVRDNYISKSYGGKYFDADDALKIGHIRELIETGREGWTEKEYNILLASLVYSADRCANTVGHYEAFFGEGGNKRAFELDVITPIDDGGTVIIHRQDANLLVAELKADIVFIDPPYNSRDYGQYYHVIEQLIKMDGAELRGKTMKPALDNKSKYCTQSALEVFTDLIKSLQCKYIVVTYNNSFTTSASSRNRMSYEDIVKVLSAKGELDVVEMKHKAFNAVKTAIEKDKHVEYLFMVKV